MFKNMKIGPKLVISTFILTLLLIASIMYVTSSQLMDYIQTTAEADTKLANQNFMTEVERSKSFAYETSHILSVIQN
jgi:hypothetical protein